MVVFNIPPDATNEINSRYCDVVYSILSNFPDLYFDIIRDLI